MLQGALAASNTAALTHPGLEASGSMRRSWWWKPHPRPEGQAQGSPGEHPEPAALLQRFLPSPQSALPGSGLGIHSPDSTSPPEQSQHGYSSPGLTPLGSASWCLEFSLPTPPPHPYPRSPRCCAHHPHTLQSTQPGLPLLLSLHRPPCPPCLQF